MFFRPCIIVQDYFSTNFNAQFNNTCMSHYYPRHVSGLDMPILRRNNCTNTASGILALLSGCTLHRLRAVCSQPVQWLKADSALNQCTAQTFTEREGTRCCVNTIFSPEDGHVNARNISRIIM